MADSINELNGIASTVPGEQEIRGGDIVATDFTLSPVITVTKKEASFTKGDLKLQKVSVTEDISVRFQHLFKKQTTPGKTIVTQIQTLEYKY